MLVQYGSRLGRHVARSRGGDGNDASKPTWTVFPFLGTFPLLIFHTERRMSSAAVPRHAAPGFWARIQDLILPIGVIASILVIIVPVPAELMDLLLAANITIAVIMLLTTLYVRTPL